MDYTPQLMSLGYALITAVAGWAWRLQRDVTKLQEQREQDEITMTAFDKDMRLNSDRLNDAHVRISVQDKTLVYHTEILKEIKDTLAKVAEAVVRLAALEERKG